MPIAVVGMLDEREQALRIIRDRIAERGHKPLLIDISIGTGAIAPSITPDVGCAELVGLAGGTIEQVRRMALGEREKVVSTVALGLTRKVVELHLAGELEGIVAIAGMTGTFISLTAMKALPFGLPKLLVSSVAAMPAYAGRLAEYLGMRDITVMHTVVDTIGMNPLVRTIAMNGANAVSGMVEAGETPPPKGKKASLALTEFGFCEKGAHHVRALLEDDFETVSFHANGMGDRAAVDLVGQGLFSAFIDLVPAGFGEYLLGGNRASGPDRLDAARDLPIPYILSPCGFDMISCGPIERRDKGDHLWVSRKLAERKFLVQDALRVQARTTPGEMEQIAGRVAEKLGRYRYKAMVKFLIPLRGFSSLDVEAGPLYDPSADKVFIETLKRRLDPGIQVIEVDSDANSPDFAAAIVDALHQAIGGPKPAV